MSFSEAEFEKYRASHEELVKIRKKEALKATGHSFTDEDLENSVDYIGGETEEEISADVERLLIELRLERKKRPADPSLGNAVKSSPKPIDLAEDGRKLYRELKDSGKLK
jgi:hypothetical protein